MRRQISRENSSGFSRIELVQESEGVYIFIYEHETSTFPERDYLVGDIEIAKNWCADDWGVPLISWEEVGG